MAQSPLLAEKSLPRLFCLLLRFGRGYRVENRCGCFRKLVAGSATGVTEGWHPERSGRCQKRRHQAYGGTVPTPALPPYLRPLCPLCCTRVRLEPL